MTTAPLSRADRALLGATLLCAAVWSTYRLADPDTFLHLAIGRGIVQSRALPTVCEQTYIEPKPAYQDHEWLGQTALYLTEQVGERGLTPLVAAWRDPEAWPPLPAPAEQAGVIGLQLGVLAVVTLVGWLVWRTGRARGASVAAFVIVASLAIPTFRFRMVPRPHLATTLGTALFAYWLFSPSRR
ncbi:MAG: hypothetical protein HYY93_09615, partial [Planctomycetes bacterium]|nr:hypothetical protein [Planctomycetota bacterium]